MGLFDFFKKKPVEQPKAQPVNYDTKPATSQPKPTSSQTPKTQPSSTKEFRGSSFERDLTQSVALTMNGMHITEQPILRFFYKDNGILEGITMSHLNDPQCDAIKAQNKTLYLSLLACHAMGCGGYVTLCQNKYKKSVSDFSLAEAMEINNAFRMTDPFELFLNTMGITPESGNKKCIDQIVRVGVNSALELLGEDVYKRENLSILMKVMYNAGITLIMR